jgi:hypothetical protein
MLTPPNCCIQVALSINRATYCFDTLHSRIRHPESGVPSCTFGRTASTNGNLVRDWQSHRAARFCQLAKYPHFTNNPHADSQLVKSPVRQSALGEGGGRQTDLSRNFDSPIRV